ncbi:hypothetical protein IQ268_05360 [Oculatella sp. LEGE 06141]|nr:hypothetical protein [Oculatella sp. LEGE 06141]
MLPEKEPIDSGFYAVGQKAVFLPGYLAKGGGKNAIAHRNRFCNRL